ncbi:3744_t:CDS:2 [Cetraspora pellucida]|uniref:3744_t:CDS:1 n=1 Tax=Cetraspora pellucida TaxID=1433469 RepID=A0A9N9CQ15_9GLOM|nr:3744_t:CDS:2 [Cetraspora pellucida]
MKSIDHVQIDYQYPFEDCEMWLGNDPRRTIKLKVNKRNDNHPNETRLQKCVRIGHRESSERAIIELMVPGVQAKCPCERRACRNA